MISVEKVLTMTCIKSPSIAMQSGGVGVFSKEDALGVLASVQSHHALGVKVLEAKVAGSAQALGHLNRTVTMFMVNRGYKESIARSLSYLAVKEVCSVPRCDKCNGVGECYSKRYSKMFECKACNGTGKILINHMYLAKHLTMLAGEKISERVFSQVYYDDYMDAINEMYVSETEAAHLISQTTDLIRTQMEYGEA